MKIYFHASVHQKAKYGLFYERIAAELRRLGHEVDATHALEHKLAYLEDRDQAQDIANDYNEVMDRIKRADAVVFEISFPSTIVAGHLLTRALQLGKPVLGLFHHGTTAALLRGWELERFRLADYDDTNLENVVRYEIKELALLPDQRFTMLLPGEIVSYLDDLSEKGINRSEFIRDLIRKAMEKNR